ncbi:MAG: hypothetical protein ACREV4_10350 [Gammaproteobacteria bacterium]
MCPGLAIAPSTRKITPFIGQLVDIYEVGSAKFCLGTYHRYREMSCGLISFLAQESVPARRKGDDPQSRIITILSTTDSYRDPAIPKLLEILELKGCIVTLDAMGYQ